MSNFWKYIFLIILFFTAMLLITRFVPNIWTYAKGLAWNNADLPLWVVGLFAPIIYLLKRIREWLSGLIGQSASEKEIASKNEAIKSEIQKLGEEVNRIDEWRRREIDVQMREIELLKHSTTSLQARARKLDELIKLVQHSEPEEFVKGMTDDEIAAEILRRLKTN